MLRQFKIEDTDQVIDLHKRVLDKTGAFIPGPWNDDMSEIEEVYIQPGGCFVVCEDDKKIIAIGALKILNPKEAEIKRMRVDISHQRKGFGQKILNYILDFAKNINIRRIILDTTENQSSAIQFYLKNDFKEYGRSSWNGFSQILFEKILSA